MQISVFSSVTHVKHMRHTRRTHCGGNGVVPSSFAYVDTGSTRHAINTHTKTPRPHPDVRQNGSNTTKPTHSLRPRVARPMSHTAPGTLPAGDGGGDAGDGPGCGGVGDGDDGIGEADRAGDGDGDTANDECMHHGPCKWDAAETPHPKSDDGTVLAIKRTRYLRLGNKLRRGSSSIWQ